jgi:hypothetical protein
MKFRSTRSGGGVATRGAAAPAAMHALQAMLAHQPGDALAADVDAKPSRSSAWMRGAP